MFNQSKQLVSSTVIAPSQTKWHFDARGQYLGLYLYADIDLWPLGGKLQ